MKPPRSPLYRQYRHRAVAALAGFSMAWLASPALAAPLPPPPPSWNTFALLEQCSAAIPRAHPWRARQLRRAMFRLQVSMSYRAAGARLSPSERRSAMAAERDSYDLLLETCRPLLT